MAFSIFFLPFSTFFLPFSIFFCSLIAVSEARLIDRGVDSLGNHLFYDEDQDVTWYDYTNQDTWENQMAWADGLEVSFNGTIYDDWRLPKIPDGPAKVWGTDGTTTWGFNMTTSELSHLWYVGLDNRSRCLLGDDQSHPELVRHETWPFRNLTFVPDGTYISSTIHNCCDNSLRNFVWTFNIVSGYQALTGMQQIGIFSAIPVRDGDVSLTPIPSSAISITLNDHDFGDVAVGDSSTTQIFPLAAVGNPSGVASVLFHPVIFLAELRIGISSLYALYVTLNPSGAESSVPRARVSSRV